MPDADARVKIDVYYDVIGTLERKLPELLMKCAERGENVLAARPSTRVPKGLDNPAELVETWMDIIAGDEIMVMVDDRDLSADPDYAGFISYQRGRENPKGIVDGKMTYITGLAVNPLWRGRGRAIQLVDLVRADMDDPALVVQLKPGDDETVQLFERAMFSHCETPYDFFAPEMVTMRWVDSRKSSDGYMVSSVPPAIR
jgi:ribosomal protein S18 acetylase RimI-like enzyme